MANCQLCGGVIAESGMVYPDYTNMCRCSPFKSPAESGKVYGLEYTPKATPMSILQQCEKMSLDEVKALIALLCAYHDCASISSHPGGFKKREADE